MSNPSSKNAMKHGCCATDTLLLATENIEDFKALESIWCKAYNPSTEPERHLVAELAQADWFLQRATKAYANVEASLYAANPNPAEWTEAQDRKLGRFLRYKTAHTNNVIKCRKSVEDYRKARLTEKATTEKLHIAQQRLNILSQKNAKTGQTWKEHLEEMRQKALSLGFTHPTQPNANALLLAIFLPARPLALAHRRAQTLSNSAFNRCIRTTFASEQSCLPRLDFSRRSLSPPHPYFKTLAWTSSEFLAQIRISFRNRVPKPCSYN